MYKLALLFASATIPSHAYRKRPTGSLSLLRRPQPLRCPFHIYISINVYLYLCLYLHMYKLALLFASAATLARVSESSHWLSVPTSLATSKVHFLCLSTSMCLCICIYIYICISWLYSTLWPPPSPAFWRRPTGPPLRRCSQP